jgi:ketosteroid isomerase-like protein
MAFTGPREAMQDIRELHETYSDAVIRQDLETYLACWSEDGRRTGTGGECSGKAELRSHWMGIFGAIEQMAFFPQLASISVDGERATARSYCLEFMKLRDGGSRQVVGEYTDELVRVDGRWVFSHRHYQVMMTP